MIKKASRSILLVLISLILSFICAEFYLRVLDPHFYNGFYEYDPDLGFRVRARFPTPDGGVTNQFGFNDKDYPLSKTPGVYRVLLLGDSFGWAGGLEGNYTALLEKKLEQHYGGHKIDIINAGYPMTYPAEQLALLKKYGLLYNPDMVILGFFAGNDFMDAGEMGKRVVVHGGCVPAFSAFPLISRSRFFLLLWRKYKIITRTWGKGPGALPERTFMDIERDRLEFFNLETAHGRFQWKIDDIFKSLSEMNDLLTSKNIKFMVAIYPDEFQVNKSLFRSLVDKYHLKEEAYSLDFAQDLLKQFLASKGVPSLDFLGEFRSAEEKNSLYLLRETHWNEAGNQAAADILFSYLVDRNAGTVAIDSQRSKQ